MYKLNGNTEAVEYIRQCLESVKDRLVTQEDADTTKVLQGYARAYTGLLSQIDNPPVTSGKR